MEGAKGRPRRCPICTEPTDKHYRPFCSRRCADVDLSRWLTGRYAFAGRAEEDEDADGEVMANPAAVGPSRHDNDDDDEEAGRTS